MPNFRRQFVPGATYFFTIVTYRRRPILDDPLARRLLRGAVTAGQETFPFEMPAIVLLPDHLHMLWKLPEGDAEYPTRLGFIKKEFTKAYLGEDAVEASTTSAEKFARRRGIWQRRFWEHTIEDEDDYENHFHYIHYNPVKHGLVQEVHQWPYSSFHRWVKEGVYPKRWACGPAQMKCFDKIARKAGE